MLHVCRMLQDIGVACSVPDRKELSSMVQRSMHISICSSMIAEYVQDPVKLRVNRRDMIFSQSYDVNSSLEASD
jgi:hypothetical protein